MRKNRLFFAVTALVLASLACNFVTGKGKNPTIEPFNPQIEPTSSSSNDGSPTADPFMEPTLDGSLLEPTLAGPSGGAGQKITSEFPLPDDVSQFMDLGGGSVNFQTGLSIKDSLDFYRTAFKKEGYKEREINTSITDATFSLVFDGHASGKAIVIQAVDLGNGNTNINIRFEDM